MEEAHRKHKEVPFGWVLWIGQALAAVRRRRARRAPWREPLALTPPDDLNRLSAPH
ncbi:hypothetical protein [Phenylobacterium sp.]|uniref:hypothetical protein n=1 Tax=Phenylobacterium sp. TaxID=1871053 RepID=UPI0035B17A25